MNDHNIPVYRKFVLVLRVNETNYIMPGILSRKKL